MQKDLVVILQIQGPQMTGSSQLIPLEGHQVLAEVEEAEGPALAAAVGPRGAAEEVAGLSREEEVEEGAHDQEAAVEVVEVEPRLGAEVGG